MDTAASAGYLCDDCRKQLQPLSRPFCERCSLPFSGTVSGEFICSHCSDKKFHFVKAVSGCRLSGVARQCIHAFKYHRALWLGPELASLMIEAALERIEWTPGIIVIAVPLYGARKREREFNQSDWLARRLVKAVPSSMLSKRNLIRTRDTPQQALLNPVQRIENVHNAFAVRHPGRLEGKRVVLVDDVFTTGATTNECARVLLAAGVKDVYVVTVARG